MSKGYVILTEAVHDQAGMDAYGRAAAPALAEAGGRILAFDPGPRVLEGDWHGDRTIVLEFPSVAAARAWYESETYQKAKALRETAAETNAVILAGFEPPAPRS